MFSYDPDPARNVGNQLASWIYIRKPDPKEVFADPQHCFLAIRVGIHTRMYNFKKIL